MIRAHNPITFENTEFVDNVVEMNNRLKHTNYPVVDRRQKCLGLLKITDLSSKRPKSVILVDHNEKVQSVEGLEEAEIKEVVDHHNIGSLTTNKPINFRNMAVGSTCTIVYHLYQEKKIPIPKEIAGAMLSGILSDTLVLKSPTATDKDIEAVNALSEIAGVDYKKYGIELLKAGTSLEGMTKEAVLYNDFKVYAVGDKNFAIGQFFTTDFSEIAKDMGEYIDVLDQVGEANNYLLVALYVTDIITNGSYVIYNSKGKDIMNVAYGLDEIPEGYYIQNCVSRKKHIVPLIMSIFEN